MASVFDDIRISGTLTIGETGLSAQTRISILRQDALAIFPVTLTDLRIWDAIQTNLTGTANTDDLAIVGTTFGTTAPVINAGDCKALGATTRYARGTAAAVGAGSHQGRAIARHPGRSNRHPVRPGSEHRAHRPVGHANHARLSVRRSRVRAARPRPSVLPGRPEVPEEEVEAPPHPLP